MKRTFLCTITVLLGLYAQSQEKDWQWINRGGALIEGDEVERVYDIATDSDRNVYVLSAIGIYGLDVAGHPENFYGDPAYSSGDYVLASFSCDGSYRWSKVIGGRDSEVRPYIEIDNNDNLYIVGSFDSCDPAEPGEYPARIGDDIILDQSLDSCSLMFITKYDTDGNLLWFERPMDLSPMDIANETWSSNMVLDSSGNIYWLVYLMPASYADGEFVNTMKGNNWFLLKYDPQGNFLNATYIDIQMSSGLSVSSLKMYRNPHNGYFYFKGYRTTNNTVTVGGEPITGGLYIACFDSQANFQWVRQNTFVSSAYGSLIYGLDFDVQNNIYLGFKFIGLGEDIFLGFSIEETAIPSLVMKTNPNATEIIWVSYNNKQTGPFGDAVLENGILTYTAWGKGTDYTWGDQTISITNDGTVEALVAFFDKNTGACIGLDFINGNPGYTDIGTALAVDANGDLLVGGQFEHTLYDANGGSVTNPSPNNPDFFIAKYATAPCGDLGSIAEMAKTEIKVWPNPVGNTLHLSQTTATSYHLHDLNGKLVQKGKIKPNQKTIEIKGLAPGVYLLELKSTEGKQVVKLVKE